MKCLFDSNNYLVATGIFVNYCVRVCLCIVLYLQNKRQDFLMSQPSKTNLKKDLIDLLNIPVCLRISL